MPYRYAKKELNRIARFQMTCKTPRTEALVGSLIVADGAIEDLWVKHTHRGKGIARRMFVEAGSPKHSPCRTLDGDAFARAVGGELPPLHAIPCAECGMSNIETGEINR